jgi:hypothetical protein
VFARDSFIMSISQPLASGLLLRQQFAEMYTGTPESTDGSYLKLMNKNKVFPLEMQSLTSSDPCHLSQQCGSEIPEENWF